MSDGCLGGLEVGLEGENLTMNKDLLMAACAWKIMTNLERSRRHLKLDGCTLSERGGRDNACPERLQ